MTDQGKPTTEHDRLADRLAKAEAELAELGPLVEAVKGLHYLAPINIKRVNGKPKIAPATFEQFEFIGDGAKNVLQAALAYREKVAGKGEGK